jgi:hypothetical protein
MKKPMRKSVKRRGQILRRRWLLEDDKTAFLVILNEVKNLGVMQITPTPSGCIKFDFKNWES